MRFFQANEVYLPDPVRDFFKLSPGEEERIDPDQIYSKVDRESDSVTFLLAKKKRGGWELETKHGYHTHFSLPKYDYLAHPISYPKQSRGYNQVYFGRLVRLPQGVVVSFWDSRGDSQDFFEPTDQQIVQEAIPVLFRKKLISKQEPLWVFGTDATIIYHQEGGQKPKPKSRPKMFRDVQKPKKFYNIGSQQYSYIEIAKALHTLPKASPEFQALVQFLNTTDAPELQGFKSRLPRSKAPGSSAPKWYELYRPENLESLGTQSRIDRYWDARTSSRRSRIAVLLVMKVKRS